MAGEKTIIFEIKYLGRCREGTGEKIVREIKLTEEHNFDDIAESLIWDSFKWYDPHLYSFFLDNRPYSKDRTKEYTCDDESDWVTGEKANPTETKLKEIRLEKKQKFLMIFDFGDHHRFEIKVKDFGFYDKKKKYPFILKETGKAPEQYESEIN